MAAVHLGVGLFCIMSHKPLRQPLGYNGTDGQLVNSRAVSLWVSMWLWDLSWVMAGVCIANRAEMFKDALISNSWWMLWVFGLNSGGSSPCTRCSFNLKRISSHQMVQGRWSVFWASTQTEALVLTACISRVSCQRHAFKWARGSWSLCHCMQIQPIFHTFRWTGSTGVQSLNSIRSFHSTFSHHSNQVSKQSPVYIIYVWQSISWPFPGWETLISGRHWQRLADSRISSRRACWFWVHLFLFHMQAEGRLLIVRDWWRELWLHRRLIAGLFRAETWARMGQQWGNRIILRAGAAHIERTLESSFLEPIQVTNRLSCL